MLKKISLLILLLGMTQLFAQELNCRVIVNSDLVDKTNQQVFRTLERALNDYVNKTKWTNKNFGENERIECSMLITVSSYEDNNFVASFQVQSSRPVYNSTYQSTVFNYNDKQFTFRYQEFEPLFFNSNVFESNLTAVINYYVYIILGIDADTFTKEGGTPYFRQAQSIVALAQGSGYPGWQQGDGNRTRWELTDNLMSNTFMAYRQTMYNYHRQGLDMMAENPALAKQVVTSSIKLFEKLNDVRPNSFLLQIFFDAKSDEIISVFSDGPKTDIVGLVNTLTKIAPVYSNQWAEIKY